MVDSRRYASPKSYLLNFRFQQMSFRWNVGIQNEYYRLYDVTKNSIRCQISRAHNLIQFLRSRIYGFSSEKITLRNRLYRCFSFFFPGGRRKYHRSTKEISLRLIHTFKSLHNQSILTESKTIKTIPYICREL